MIPHLPIALVACLPTPQQFPPMSGVAEVTATAVESPSRRVVYLLNWHWIPEDHREAVHLFAALKRSQ